MKLSDLPDEILLQIWDSIDRRVYHDAEVMLGYEAHQKLNLRCLQTETLRNLTLSKRFLPIVQTTAWKCVMVSYILNELPIQLPALFGPRMKKQQQEIGTLTIQLIGTPSTRLSLAMAIKVIREMIDACPNLGNIALHFLDFDNLATTEYLLLSLPLDRLAQLELSTPYIPGAGLSAATFFNLFPRLQQLRTCIAPVDVCKTMPIESEVVVQKLDASFDITYLVIFNLCLGDSDRCIELFKHCPNLLQLGLFDPQTDLMAKESFWSAIPSSVVYLKITLPGKVNLPALSIKHLTRLVNVEVTADWEVSNIQSLFRMLPDTVFRLAMIDNHVASNALLKLGAVVVCLKEFLKNSRILPNLRWLMVKNLGPISDEDLLGICRARHISLRAQ